MELDIDPEIIRELNYIVELHQTHGAPNTFDNVENLICYVISSVADGSRRPGSWERQLLQFMGLVADCDEHNVYRQHYGKPDVRVDSTA